MFVHTFRARIYNLFFTLHRGIGLHMVLQVFAGQRSSDFGKCPMHFDPERWEGTA